MLNALGFSPRVAEHLAADVAVVHLRTCHLLNLALASPDVVWDVHLGVIGGVLGAPAADTTWNRSPPPARAWSGSATAVTPPQTGRGH